VQWPAVQRGCGRHPADGRRTAPRGVVNGLHATARPASPVRRDRARTRPSRRLVRAKVGSAPSGGLVSVRSSVPSASGFTQVVTPWMRGICPVAYAHTGDNVSEQLILASGRPSWHRGWSGRARSVGEGLGFPVKRQIFNAAGDSALPPRTPRGVRADHRAIDNRRPQSRLYAHRMQHPPLRPNSPRHLR
jgi:hypothetical protein